MEAWKSLEPEVKAALIASEMSAASIAKTSSVSSMASSSNRSDDSGEKNESEGVSVEECAESGTKTVLRPLERAPKNVFEITKTTSRAYTDVTKTSSSVVTTTKTVMTTTKGWRNVYTLPISYDINMVPNGTLLDPANPQMLEATGVHPEGYNRRFAVIDDQVDKIYGKKIRDYFTAQGIELSTVVINGGEPDKRPAVSTTSGSVLILYIIFLNIGCDLQRNLFLLIF